MNKIYALAGLLFAGSAAMAQNAVTFSVDMNTQNPLPTQVLMAGSLGAVAGYSDWNDGVNNPGTAIFLTDGDGDNVWEITLSLPDGSYEYKFLNGPGGWESVPGSCAVNSNRGVTVAGAAVTQPTVCLNSCTTCPTGTIPTYNVVFNVDMGTTCDFDSVDIAGTINGWSGGNAYIMDDTDGDGVYSITLPVDSGDAEFKFRRYYQGNVNWEGIANRMMLINADMSIPATCFNETVACTPIPAPGTITFRVDMTNEAPDATGVFVIGDFTSPSWQAGAIELMPDLANPGFYEASYTMCPGTFFYKYVNGDPRPGGNPAFVEEGFPGQTPACAQPNGLGGWNRVYTRPDNMAHTLGYVFNTCTEILSSEEFVLNGFNLYPNPVTGVSTVDLGQGSYSVRVLDLNGRVLSQFDNASGSISINAADYSAGIYVMSVSSERGTASTRFVVR